jgi:Uncharacterized protein conserved in bacteria (DUF2314)
MAAYWSRVAQLVSVAALLFACGKKEEPPPSPAASASASRERPVIAEGKSQSEELVAAIAPYVEKARQTYPSAKQRFLAGLPAGDHFFAGTRLRDATDSREQVFIAVSAIEGGRINGTIDSEVIRVKGYKQGDTYSFSERELTDWLISHPDGSEEGNVVGKFLDDWQKTKAAH